MPGRLPPAGRAHALSAKAGQEAMPVTTSKEDPDRARSFREAALPLLDDVYTLARYLLRNVGRAEYARRATAPSTTLDDAPEHGEQSPMWHEEQQTPETAVLKDRDAITVRKLVYAPAEPFKETFVLREINNLSYREIAEAVGAPVGTIMSRLARARAMLRSAWLAEQEQAR